MSDPSDSLSEDGFLGGKLKILQPLRGYRAATDPVLLAAFVDARPGEMVLDLGCGVGVAALCLAARVPGMIPHGLEIQPDYARLARRNAASNGIAMTVHLGDLRRPPVELRALSFDHVMINPPFYPAGTVTAPKDPGRDIAHREEAPLGDWIAAGLRRLRPGGRIVLIHRAERLASILAALDGPAGDIEVLPISARPGHPAGRVLIRARKGRVSPLRLHAPLVVHAAESHSSDAGAYAPLLGRVLRGEADLLAMSKENFS